MLKISKPSQELFLAHARTLAGHRESRKLPRLARELIPLLHLIERENYSKEIEIKLKKNSCNVLQNCLPIFIWIIHDNDNVSI